MKRLPVRSLYRWSVSERVIRRTRQVSNALVISLVITALTLSMGAAGRAVVAQQAADRAVIRLQPNRPVAHSTLEIFWISQTRFWDFLGRSLVRMKGAFGGYRPTPPPRQYTSY